MDDKEPFLSRWSRRKLETKENVAAVAPQAAAAPAVSAPIPGMMAAPVPGTDEGASREYREFFDPQVDEGLRRTALKKLFGEPQFNVMDGLDTYIDDYSKPDPIPEAMLRQLNQAKDLLLFDEDEKPDARTNDGMTPAGEPAALAEASASAVPTAGIPGNQSEVGRKDD